ASHFRMGPTFLAGDAAHVHSPLGGQGMNTGLQDSHHLANLLADVARGRLAPAALERYERERLPVARKLIAVTDRAFGLIARAGASLCCGAGSAAPSRVWFRPCSPLRWVGGWAGCSASTASATARCRRASDLHGGRRIRRWACDFRRPRTTGTHCDRWGGSC